VTLKGHFSECKFFEDQCLKNNAHIVSGQFVDAGVFYIILFEVFLIALLTSAQQM